MSNIVEKILDVPAEHESNVFGQFDSHIKKIEQTLKVSVVARDGEVKILGPRRVHQTGRPVSLNSFWSCPDGAM